jgi:hypothetical protein
VRELRDGAAVKPEAAPRSGTGTASNK